MRFGELHGGSGSANWTNNGEDKAQVLSKWGGAHLQDFRDVQRETPVILSLER